MIKHIVDEGLGHLPGHPFLHILAYKVAVFAGQLAILGDDEGDVLRHAGLPRFVSIFDFSHMVIFNYSNLFINAGTCSVTIMYTCSSTSSSTRAITGSFTRLNTITTTIYSAFSFAIVITSIYVFGSIIVDFCTVLHFSFGCAMAST